MNPVTDDVRLAQRERPEERPVMSQTWRSLLFLHWRFDPERIQPFLPRGLTVDTFEGSAWVGVVPFQMRNIRPRWAPAVPYISNFLELNLRTYAVNEEGVPGVWFWSLDASRLIAVGIARAWFGLPYHWAAMSIRKDSTDWIDYQSQRRGTPESSRSAFRYRPQGAAWEAEPGSLEFFLAERYILFSCDTQGRISTGQVHHRPYPLQRVDVERHDSQLLALSGLPDPGRPFDQALYSEGVDVEVFGLRRSRS